MDERRDDEVECGEGRALPPPPALKLPLDAKADTLTLTRGVLRLDAATGVRGLREFPPPPRRLALKSLVLFIRVCRYEQTTDGSGSGCGQLPNRISSYLETSAPTGADRRPASVRVAVSLVTGEAPPPLLDPGSKQQLLPITTRCCLHHPIYLLSRSRSSYKSKKAYTYAFSLSLALVFYRAVWRLSVP